MKYSLSTAFVLMISLIAANFLAPAQAQEENVVISPRSIIVNPRPAFNVEVFVDRDPSNTSIPNYRIGDEIEIGVRATEDAYIYLFNVRSDGVITQILPNRFDQAGRNNFVRANQTTFFPPRGANYSFEVAGPRGLDKVIAVASRDQLDLATLSRFQDDGGFLASSEGEESFARTLSIVVRPVNQNRWVTDTALFTVGDNVQPVFGTLDIRSTPRGARAFVDGQFVGFTPVSFGTRSGSRTVRVEQDGFRPFETTVNLRAGQTLDINTTLAEIPRLGSLVVQSNIGGVDIFINGRSVGRISSSSRQLRIDDLPIGGHSLRLEAAGHITVEQNFTIEANRTTNLNLSLARIIPQGRVSFRSSPAGADVFISGTLEGQTPINNLTLDEGSYEVRIRRSGFRDATFRIDIEEGSDKTISVNLVR